MTWSGAAYCSSAVPFVVLLLLRRDHPREYWVFALACATSAFIDMAVRAGGGGFAAAHVFIGVQAVIFASAMTKDLRPLLVMSFVIALAASVAPLIMFDDPHRMVFVSLVAIPTLGWRLWTWDHELKWAVGTYIVVAGLLSAWMVSYYPHDPESFDQAFVVYTLARWCSFGLFIHEAYRWKEPPQSSIGG